MGFFRRTIHTTIFKFLDILILFVCSVVIARKLGPYYKGIFTGLLLVPWLMVIVGNLGIDISNTYFIANNKKKANIYFSNSLISSILLSLILMPSGWLIFHLFYKNILESVTITLGLFVLILIPMSLLTRYLSGLMKGFNEIEKNNIVIFYKNVAYLIMIMLLLLLQSIKVDTLVFVVIFTELFAVLFYILFLSKFFDIRISITKYNLKEFKKSFSYGFKGSLANIFSFLNYRIDMLLIMKFLTPNLLGIYSITAMIAEKIWLFPSILSSVLFPHIAKYKDANFTAFLSRFTFLFTLILILFLIIFLKPLIILVYSNKFACAYVPFLYLVPGIIFLSVGKLIASDLIGRGFTNHTMKSAIISALVNIVMNVILIPKYKLNGAAFASAVSYSLNSWYLILIYCKLTNTKIREVFLLTKDDIKFIVSYRNRILRKI